MLSKIPDIQLLCVMCVPAWHVLSFIGVTSTWLLGGTPDFLQTSIGEIIQPFSLYVCTFLLSINFWIKETITIVKNLTSNFLWTLILLSKVKKKKNECVRVTVAYRRTETNYNSISGILLQIYPAFFSFSPILKINGCLHRKKWKIFIFSKWL